jgi:hypothetical protein
VSGGDDGRRRASRRRRVWTSDDTATLVRMARAGYGDGEIGRHLGLSAAAVGRKRRALNIAAGVPARLRVVMARRALAMAANDHSHAYPPLSGRLPHSRRNRPATGFRQQS